MSIDEMVREHGQQITVLGIQVARISTVLGIGEGGAESKVCPKCGKPIPTNEVGALLPHQIDGAVLAPGRRRSGSVCLFKPEAVAS